MYWIGLFIYDASIRIYYLLVLLASVNNQKAKQFINGRQGVLDEVADKYKNDLRKKYWFHCASLGEFEQARPIIEELTIRQPNLAIIITFFSPSGYEIRKNYPLADSVFYLPIDTKYNANKFIKALKPALVFFIKYEVWNHYLVALNKLHIPIFLLSANFRADHIYFKWYGAFFKDMLNRFTHIFTQNNQSLLILNRNGIINSSVSYDTRFDRVHNQTMIVKAIEIVEKFKGNCQLLVVGSSYKTEEDIIASSMSNTLKWKIVIAPHHIEEGRLLEIENRFQQFLVLRYSQIYENDKNIEQAQVLIIDNIGLLSSIYQYATAAFVGGGFGKNGLHNILEPAAFGMPVFFGPNNHQKFPESTALVNAGGAIVINDSQQLFQKLDEWQTNKKGIEKYAIHSKEFVSSQIGATQLICNYLVDNQLL